MLTIPPLGITRNSVYAAQEYRTPAHGHLSNCISIWGTAYMLPRSIALLLMGIFSIWSLALRGLALLPTGTLSKWNLALRSLALLPTGTLPKWGSGEIGHHFLIL